MTRTRLAWAAVAVAATLAVLAAVALRSDGVGTAGRSPRSVILVVGDGMASAQREAARLALAGTEGRLGMDDLPVLGLQTTEPADAEDAVTDSAAAATAWATGERTVNGALSVDPDGDALQPLGLEAAQHGKATGLVTTSQVTDATPGAFFASVRDRSDQDEVAAQYLEGARPDVVLGGGRGRWTEGDDLLAEAREQGYDVVGDREGLLAAGGERLLGLFADEEMWVAEDEGDGDAYDPEVRLAEMTRVALDRLSRDRDGFFLLVEEEAVDAMGHANNGTRVLQAMAELEQAVEVARRYVADHPDTLLVVTGDHEAGGLALEDWEGDEDQDGPFPVAGSDRVFALDWTSGGHTGVPTPVTASGPGSERLAGTYPNTHLHEVLRSVLLG